MLYIVTKEPKAHVKGYLAAVMIVEENSAKDAIAQAKLLDPNSFADLNDSRVFKKTAAKPLLYNTTYLLG